MNKPLVDLTNWREPEQLASMQASVAAGECPFCREHLQKYHTQPILREGAHWLMTDNQWPYNHTERHLLIIYREHLEGIGDVPPAAGAELLELVQWAIKEYNIVGGGWAMRFGETSRSGASVVHLHAHLIAPAAGAEQPVRFKIG
jgi:ATP adenylyltransferase